MHEEWEEGYRKLFERQRYDDTKFNVWIDSALFSETIGKYVYKKDDAAVLKETIRGYRNEFFLNAEIQYFT